MSQPPLNPHQRKVFEEGKPPLTQTTSMMTPGVTPPTMKLIWKKAHPLTSSAPILPTSLKRMSLKQNQSKGPLNQKQNTGNFATKKHSEETDRETK